MRQSRIGLSAALTVALAAFLAAPLTAKEVQPTGAASSPTVSLECSQDSLACWATASGGTGVGYTFDWSSNVVETYDEDGASAGDVLCNGYWGWISVSVLVRDSLNAVGHATANLDCSP